MIVSIEAGELEAAWELNALRSSLQRLGGSAAQRELFEMMLIDAGLKGAGKVGRAVLESRLSSRPSNVWAHHRARLAKSPHGSN